MFKKRLHKGSCVCKSKIEREREISELSAYQEYLNKSNEKPQGSKSEHQFNSVQSLSRVQLFVTPWTAERQASLSITNSQILLKLMSIELVLPSNRLILCCPLLLPPSIFPSIRVFLNESGQSIGISASASVLPMNIQD